MKGAPRSASKLGIDPINSHASYFVKITGSNKRSVPINRTMSSNCHQRVCSPTKINASMITQIECIVSPQKSDSRVRFIREITIVK